MKKQINPTIKAHLLRSAFYLLLFLAICAIPFALAQRNSTKRSRAASISQLPASQLPQGSSGPTLPGGCIPSYTLALGGAPFVPGDTDIGSHSNANTYSHSNGHAYGDGNGYSDGNSNCDGYTNSNGAASNADGDAYGPAEAYTDASASSVACRTNWNR